MKLIMENWRGYIDEAEGEEDFDNFLDKVFSKVANVLGVEIEDTGDEISQEVEKEQQLDEGVLFALGVTLAAPAIAKLFAGVARVFGNSIKGWTGKDIGANKLADKIVSYADKAHHLFQKPIELFVKKVLRIQDEAKAKHATGILFTLLIAFLMVYSGVGAASAAVSGKTGLAGFEGALAAVKGGEVSAYIKSTLKQVAGAGV